MLSALPRLERQALFSRLARGTQTSLTLVTSSRRQAQALRRAFDASQAAEGRMAWESADIIPFAAWVERFWDDALYSDLAADLPLLLAGSQEQALWEDCIRGVQRQPLLSVPAAADEALEAWSLAHAWRLAPRLAASAQHEDARAFVQWADRYERATRERRQIERARLPDLVASMLEHEALRKPHELVLAGFDLLTPQQEDFLRRIEKLGVPISALSAEWMDARLARVSFATVNEEIEAAARWARSRLEAAPGARIGVVVPDLARARSRVERIFTRTLDPMHGVAAERPPLPFNLSLGIALSEWPIVHDALALLRLAGRDVAFEEASALLRSPFIAGAESERAARDALDGAVRRRSGARVSLDALARLARGSNLPSAPVAAGLLERLAEFRRSELFERRGAAQWARAMEATLRRAGFPGERTLDSAEYQAWTKWHEALGEFAALEHVTRRMGYTEACERLARVASGKLFQPETPDVPIQVLGLLESVGLDFDHLWVTGLSDEAWPMPPRANPFIPLALQRSAGIPHADAAASLELDERITREWRQSAAEVVLSHARMREDTEIAASALIADLRESDAEALRLLPREALRDALHAADGLERIDDGRAPAVAASERTGGTGLFRDQAACPFRAFARHRLHSQPLERPEPGLDAAARGTLVHEMLARVWEALGEKARLDAIDEAGLAALLADCAGKAIEARRRFHPEALSGRFEALERERLIGTTREWLDKERAREPFHVVAIEEKRPMTFGGITVNVKLDRMDALARGGRAVIDYKTGAAAVSSWLGPRPDEPQLPMYTLGSGEDVRAVAFARLKRGEMRFCGFAMEEGLVPKVSTVGTNRSQGAGEYRDWSAMVAGWREKLEALGREFASGEARVDPKHRDTCEQCDQHLFCRIAEKRPQLLDGLPLPGDVRDE